ncbi:zonadhesin-like [Cydia fagiglandana]|uniref:zonadhesin-like n=1 Tax=Cydia fagiglandana TaxID=1458189 RepID=UPI002FEE4FA3
MLRTILVLAMVGLCGADYDIQCDASQHLVVDCRQPCPPEKTCQNKDDPIPPCVPPMGPCKKQCVCEDGYAKNQWGGYCITYAQCDKCPGNNQYFACDGPYSQNCTGSCHCTDGYARDANGTCVSTAPPPVDNHPPPPPLITPSPPVTAPTKGPIGPKLACDNATRHETLACRFGCPPEPSCLNRHRPPPSCAPPAPWLKCTDQCVCAKGYVRNKPSGVCVTEKQCDKCPGENEYFQCDGDNEPNCDGHCNCLSNHVRDKDGKCVYVDPTSTPKVDPPPVTTTEKPPCTKPLSCDNATRHEVPSCVYICPREPTCESRNWPHTTCPPPTLDQCLEKCVCDAGYIRNKLNGQCISTEQCDLCSGDNEYFECDGEYAEDCDGHCYCSFGYARDKDGNCVYVYPASPPKLPDPPKAETKDKCPGRNGNICVSTTLTPPPRIYKPPPPYRSRRHYPIQPVEKVQAVQKGSTSAKGSTGAKGSTSAKGSTGAKGSTSAKGSSSPTGSIGAACSTG